MSDEKNLDKTNVVDGDTLKLRLADVNKAPPAFVLLMGPQGLMGKQWNLEADEMSLGRDASVDIYIQDASVSKKHAKVFKKDGAIQICDLGSTNGTEVQNSKLAPNTPVSLSDGDRIKLGNVILKFLKEGSMESVAMGMSYDRGNVDGLTRIFNKTAILSHLEEAFKKARLTETPLSLIVFDLDHFKDINTNYLHTGGDYVLREMATVVKNSLIRAGDSFGRYGGEEFVVVLAGSPLQRACDIAERIRATIEKHEFMFSGKKIKVTVSLGVATLDGTLNTSEELFAKADQALFESKSAGRNRVSTL